MKIKKGDNVIVLKGKERGKKGKVQKAFPKEGKLIIEGMNMRKKHVKPKRAGEKGQIVQLAGFIPVANVGLVCPKCLKPTRLGFKMQGSKKYRFCKRCKAEVDL